MILPYTYYLSLYKTQSTYIYSSTCNLCGLGLTKQKHNVNIVSTMAGPDLRVPLSLFPVVCMLFEIGWNGMDQVGNNETKSTWFLCFLFLPYCYCFLPSAVRCYICIIPQFIVYKPTTTIRFCMHC
jgi:hypothetical protein